MRIAGRITIRLVAIGLCVALAGCSAPAPTPAGGSSSSKADKARREAENLAVSGVNGGASAHAKHDPGAAVRHKLDINVTIDPGSVSFGKGTAADAATGKGAVPPAAGAQPAPAPAAPEQGSILRSAPRPGSLIRERVFAKGSFLTEAEAEEETLALAREKVEQYLARLDPPLRHAPSLGEVKAEFIRKDSRTVRPPTAAERAQYAAAEWPSNVVFVEYDIEITADQVRELRAQDRAASALRIVGIVLVVALAGFLFLRADEWTKGYLTRWLAFAAVLLAGGTAAALIFV